MYLISENKNFAKLASERDHAKPGAYMTSVPILIVGIIFKNVSILYIYVVVLDYPID